MILQGAYQQERKMMTITKTMIIRLKIFLWMKRMKENADNEPDDESDADGCADDCFNIVDIVWGKYGRIWYPAVAAALEDVPENICQYLGCNIEGKRIVKWWGEEDFSALAEKNVEPLAQNQVDEFWAKRSKVISKLYHQAVTKSIMED